jgi:glycosyltransferase involved in cell wall biosynthesis
VEIIIKRPLRIAILSHEFLINIGANDFLKNILRSLSLRDNEIYFLCPRSNERIEHIASETTKNRLRKIPYLKQTLRGIVKHIGAAADIIAKDTNNEYDFYLEACPGMKIVTCESNARSLDQIKNSEDIDVFLPSIHPLPTSLPYVTYWPDCQPKHFPKFFDEDAQRVRDERIFSLFCTGKPMIINSLSAKMDMVKFYDADPSHIFNLPFAPIIEFEKLIPHPELRLKYGLNRKYFLISNQFWIHKSIETAIEAGLIAKNKGLDVDLVFTGRMEEPRKPGYIDQLREMVVDLDLGDTIKFLGYIPKKDQIEIMKGSIAVIQPTLFEGGPGGGAVYDAFSLGIRAIVSDIPVNRELPNDDHKVLFFETKNPKDLVDKMEIYLKSSYHAPSIEDLYQLSQHSAELLSNRLYEAIDFELSTSN